MLLVVLAVELSFCFGVGVSVNDKDVWSSSSEKGTIGGRSLEVRFDEAATHWTDALPVGNGRLGAMIWGGIANETINLNGNFLSLSLPLLS